MIPVAPLRGAGARGAATRSVILRAAWALGLALAAVLCVRAFVGYAYHVDSGSMAPTLWGLEGGGEWVFVLHDRSPPARGDLVVLERPGETALIVKRVAGLPGESVQVSGGDVLVRGRRLPESESRTPHVLLYDQQDGLVSDRFPPQGEQQQIVRCSAGLTEIDARAVPRDANLGLLFLAGELDDDYLGPDGALVRGRLQANDARIECEAAVLDAGAQLRLGLVEQGDTFQLQVITLEGGRAQASLTRRNGTDGIVLLASENVAWELGAFQRVALENRDNFVSASIGLGSARTRLTAEYRENAMHSSDELREGRSFGSRAWFGGEGGRFRFREVRLERDLCYAARGAYAVAAPLELGPHEFFVLGDHSGQSRDSREWGPVQEREIVGRPAFVLWPPARWRSLGTAAERAP